MCIPYGYRIVDGVAEPDPDESRRLQMFFKLYLQGNTATVAAKKAGIPRTSACCRNMLKKTVYCGTDYYPPLISPKAMRAVEEETEKRSQRRRGKGDRKQQHPFPAKTEFYFASVPDEIPADPASCAELLYSCIHVITDGGK